MDVFLEKDRKMIKSNKLMERGKNRFRKKEKLMNI